jgi:hypothetical protein
MEEGKKRELIDKLVKIYPYPRSWFQNKSIPQCMAMLMNHPKPRAKKQELKPVEIQGNKIRTDSGRFEEMYD